MSGVEVVGALSANASIVLMLRLLPLLRNSGYSIMQDHDVLCDTLLIISGAWLHTRNAERQTPTRIAWWRSSARTVLPYTFALFKASKPPEDVYEIYDYLLQNGNFAKALRQCDIDLWDFARIEAKVLTSNDRDEPLQYVTHTCYHRRNCERTHRAHYSPR